MRIDRRRKLPVTTLLYALGMDDEEILSSFYKTITVKETQARLEGAVRGGEDARHDAGIRPHRRAVGRGGGQGGREDHRQARPRAGRGRPQGGAVQRQRPRRQVPGRGHRQHGDGPDLRRGRRRAERQAAGDPERGQGQGFPDPRHRPRHGRRLHPQHPQRRQELQPRGSVDGRLPGDAPGRAADAGCGAGPVPRPVLRLRSATTSPPSAASR